MYCTSRNVVLFFATEESLWVMARGLSGPLSRLRKREYDPAQTQARSGDAGDDPSHMEPKYEECRTVVDPGNGQLHRGTM